MLKEQEFVHCGHLHASPHKVRWVGAVETSNRTCPIGHDTGNQHIVSFFICSYLAIAIPFETQLVAYRTVLLMFTSSGHRVFMDNAEGMVRRMLKQSRTAFGISLAFDLVTIGCRGGWLGASSGWVRSEVFREGSGSLASGGWSSILWIRLCGRVMTFFEGSRISTDLLNSS